MALKYGFYHVELGQLLREEAQRSTQRGRQIRDIMQKGLLVPTILAEEAPESIFAKCCSVIESLL